MSAQLRWTRPRPYSSELHYVHACPFPSGVVSPFEMVTGPRRHPRTAATSVTSSERVSDRWSRSPFPREARTSHVDLPGVSADLGTSPASGECRPPALGVRWTLSAAFRVKGIVKGWCQESAGTSRGLNSRSGKVVLRPTKNVQSCGRKTGRAEMDEPTGAAWGREFLDTGLRGGMRIESVHARAGSFP